MTSIRQPDQSSLDRGRMVVRGPARLGQVWPAERPERQPVIVPARTAEIGDPDAVATLLGAVDGIDGATYRSRNPLSVVALRALAAHCEAAVLQAAARVHDDLTPEAVLDEVHADLRTPVDVHATRLAS